MRNDFLAHHGILGMKWGVRRYQNPDGTLTEAGKKRYGSGETLFVSGSSKTQDKSSGYYRKKLPYEVRSELKKSMKNKDKIIVGDAPGIDRQVQDYLKKKKYDDVEVYGPGKKVRYSANEKWKTNPIDAPQYEEGSKEWLAEKDKAMTKAATKALAVILDEGAKATRNNIKRLEKQKKKVKVLELSKYGAIGDKWIDEESRRLAEESARIARQNHQQIMVQEQNRLFQEQVWRQDQINQQMMNQIHINNMMMHQMHMF